MKRKEDIVRHSSSISKIYLKRNHVRGRQMRCSPVQLRAKLPPGRWKQTGPDSTVLQQSICSNRWKSELLWVYFLFTFTTSSLNLRPVHTFTTSSCHIYNQFTHINNGKTVIQYRMILGSCAVPLNVIPPVLGHKALHKSLEIMSNVL